MLVGESERALRAVPETVFTVLFSGGWAMGWRVRQIIENQYLSQSPSEIFSIFFQTPIFHKSLIFLLRLFPFMLLAWVSLGSGTSENIKIAISYSTSNRIHGNGISFFITEMRENSLEIFIVYGILSFFFCLFAALIFRFCFQGARNLIKNWIGGRFCLIAFGVELVFK